MAQTRNEGPGKEWNSNGMSKLSQNLDWDSVNVQHRHQLHLMLDMVILSFDLRLPFWSG